MFHKFKIKKNLKFNLRKYNKLMIKLKTMISTIINLTIIIIKNNNIINKHRITIIIIILNTKIMKITILNIKLMKSSNKNIIKNIIKIIIYIIRIKIIDIYQL